MSQDREVPTALSTSPFRSELNDAVGIKIRKYKLATQRVVIFLRTQQFRDFGREVDLSGPTQFPNDILRAVAQAFESLFDPSAVYRATGVILSKLTEAYYGQLDLFGEAIRM